MPSVDIVVRTDCRGSELSSTVNLPTLVQTPSGLAMIEVQGTIHIPAPLADIDMTRDASDARTPIGRLEFPGYPSTAGDTEGGWMKRVYLYVGKHQRMLGEVKKLPKPLGILRKEAASGDGGDREILSLSDIITHKIVFAQRPEPVGNE